jgi:hypothetical protein
MFFIIGLLVRRAYINDNDYHLQMGGWDELEKAFFNISSIWASFK